MSSKRKYPINWTTQIADFEKKNSRSMNDNEKELFAIMAELQNQAYRQGVADALNSDNWLTLSGQNAGRVKGDTYETESITCSNGTGAGA